MSSTLKDDAPADISMQDMAKFWDEEKAKGARNEWATLQKDALANIQAICMIPAPRFIVSGSFSEWEFSSGVEGIAGPVGVPGPAGAIGPPGSPAPRAHDFSNPYLIDHHIQVGHRLCVECGFNYDGDGVCEPRPGWRAVHEANEATKMETRDLLAKANQASRGPDRPATYRNDVGGIGALVGRYLNVAPERGR